MICEWRSLNSVSCVRMTRLSIVEPGVFARTSRHPEVKLDRQKGSVLNKSWHETKYNAQGALQYFLSLLKFRGKIQTGKNKSDAICYESKGMFTWIESSSDSTVFSQWKTKNDPRCLTESFLIGSSGGSIEAVARNTPRLKCLHFMQFLGKNGQIVGWRPPLGVGARLGNRGSATGIHSH